jgi:N-acylneuraminate cytidylyltransferase
MAPASNCPIIDVTYVATDHQKIKEVVEKLQLPRVQVYSRSSENAQDSSTTESLLLEVINALALNEDDIIVLLQATSPFTQAAQIQEAIKLFKDLRKPVLTASPFNRFIWTSAGKPINYDPMNRPRRQDFENKYLVENGAFYVNSVSNIQSSKNRLGSSHGAVNVAIYEMPDYAYLELDEPDDWKIAERKMREIRFG